MAPKEGASKDGAVTTAGAKVEARTEPVSTIRTLVESLLPLTVVFGTRGLDWTNPTNVLYARIAFGITVAFAFVVYGLLYLKVSFKFARKEPKVQFHNRNCGSG